LKLKKLFNRYQDDFVYLMPFISATKLVFAMLWMSHWMGCTYALVFPFEEQDKPMNSLSSKYLCGNQPVRRAHPIILHQVIFGDDAAVLAPSSDEEPAPPRHRAGAASMAWRSTRRFSTNAP
jgi:hypothetical protein